MSEEINEFCKRVKSKIDAKIDRIKKNEMYPAYCLNGVVSGLEDALIIINEEMQAK